MTTETMVDPLDKPSFILLDDRMSEEKNEEEKNEGKASVVEKESQKELETELGKELHHDSLGSQAAADDSSETQTIFQCGDHLYRWCSLGGVPGMFQLHGIVTEIEGDELVVVDFDSFIRRNSDEPFLRMVLDRRRRGVRLFEKERKHEWMKVQYEASWWKRGLWRSGTCTAVKSDPRGIVLARVAFLLNNRDKVPAHHFLKANCECVAVWCMTGTWATLQTSTFLHATAAGQAKSATTLALYATSQQVSVPAAGVWGFMGFTTKVSLLAIYPYLMPAIAGYGLVTVGGPVWLLARAKRFWNQTTQQLNIDFWEDAMQKPEEFADSVTDWSQM